VLVKKCNIKFKISAKNDGQYRVSGNTGIFPLIHGGKIS
jgi:hypothetical protein